MDFNLLCKEKNYKLNNSINIYDNIYIGLVKCLYTNSPNVLNNFRIINLCDGLNPELIPKKSFQFLRRKTFFSISKQKNESALEIWKKVEPLLNDKDKFLFITEVDFTLSFALSCIYLCEKYQESIDFILAKLPQKQSLTLVDYTMIFEKFKKFERKI